MAAGVYVHHQAPGALQHSGSWELKSISEKINFKINQKFRKTYDFGGIFQTIPINDFSVSYFQADNSKDPFLCRISQF